MSEVIHDNEFEIAGKVYILSSLRMKHLKQMAQLIEQGNIGGGIVNKLAVWTPYIEFSIKQMHPEFNVELLDELTLPQSLELWIKIQAVSGIKIGATGETRPTQPTGASSTGASVLPSAGITA